MHFTFLIIDPCEGILKISKYLSKYPKKLLAVTTHTCSGLKVNFDFEILTNSLFLQLQNHLKNTLLYFFGLQIFDNIYKATLYCTQLNLKKNKLNFVKQLFFLG